MSNAGKPERITQDRVIRLFRDEPGYHSLGKTNVASEILGPG